jgi:hypothetical protein
MMYLSSDLPYFRYIMTSFFVKPWLFFLSIVMLLQTSTLAQSRPEIRVSLLTCTPGDELYSLFGHTAIRITDSSAATDVVYNYGTFNFDDKNFYLKFVQGKLNYFVSADDFETFKYQYQVTNRGITEQVLMLSSSEKIALHNFLRENLNEENRYYQYDFFFNNCTTKIRDILLKMKSPPPHLPAVMPITTRFRQAIHAYLDKGQQPWSKLGIDILLGAKTDRVMTASDQQFLPDNLMKSLDSSRNNGIVQSSQNLYQLEPIVKNTGWFSPMVFFASWLLLMIVLQITAKEKWPVLIGGLDGLLFFLTGFLGIVLILMWVATDHSMTKDNYNLLWAIPSHILISFFINSRKKWVKMYWLFTSIAGILLLTAWAFLPQQLNIALISFVVLLTYRAFIRYKHI